MLHERVKSKMLARMSENKILLNVPEYRYLICGIPEMTTDHLNKDQTVIELVLLRKQFHQADVYNGPECITYSSKPLCAPLITDHERMWSA